MGRSEYYEEMKALARSVRAEFGISVPRVLKSDLRRIFRHHGIEYELWPHKFKKLRGAFINDNHGPSIMVAKNMPEEPTVFTMAHELKHFLKDKDIATSYCDPSNQHAEIEIGAEVFAAELLFPDNDFKAHMASAGVTLGNCTAENLVRLKNATKTTLSYAGLVKKAVFHGFALKSVFDGVKWKHLEEMIFGVPFYKRFKGRRNKKN